MLSWMPSFLAPEQEVRGHRLGGGSRIVWAGGRRTTFSGGSQITRSRPERCRAVCEERGRGTGTFRHHLHSRVRSPAPHKAHTGKQSDRDVHAICRVLIRSNPVMSGYSITEKSLLAVCPLRRLRPTSRSTLASMGTLPTSSSCEVCVVYWKC